MKHNTKNIKEFVRELGYEVELTSYKINMIKYILKKYKNKSNVFIESMIFNVLHNDKQGMGEIFKFINTYYFTNDIHENFIIYQKQDNEPIYFISNNKQYNLDMVKMELNEIDFPLVYMNNEMYAITLEPDKTCENILENVIYTINNENYYVTPLIPINVIENPDKYKTIQGKDWIKHYLYNDINESGVLYFITIKQQNKIFYKVGITKNSVKERFSNKINIIDSKEIKLNMLECSIIEKYIHENFTHLKEYNILDDFEGKTECYINDMYKIYNEHIFDKSLEYLDSINYPLSASIIKSILKERQGEN